MRQFRCLNDLFGYCREEPEFGEPIKVMGEDEDGNEYVKFEIPTCSAAPGTCGKHLTVTQLYPLVDKKRAKHTKSHESVESSRV